MKKFFKSLFCFLGAFVLGFGLAVLPFINTRSSYAAVSNSVDYNYNYKTFYNSQATRFYFGTGLNTNNEIGINQAITGLDFWSDGNYLYFSAGTAVQGQYSYLADFSDMSDYTRAPWSIGNATNLAILGRYVWSHNNTFYYNYGSTSLVYDVGTRTWSSFTWSGLSSFDGWNVWTYEGNYYYNNGVDSYILDSSTNTWTSFTWSGDSSVTFNGRQVWSYQGNYYFNDGLLTYKLDFNSNSYSLVEFTFETPVRGTAFNRLNLINFGSVIYYLDGVNSYVFDSSSNSWNLTTDFAYFGYPFSSYNKFVIGQQFVVVNGILFLQQPSNSSFTVPCGWSLMPVYYDGYNAGYNDGYNAGYSAGFTAGANSSSTADSYNNGYNVGYNAGYSAGISTNSGYNAGYNSGYNVGYNTGYSAGSSDGYNSGYSEGSREGYNTGYNEGVEDSNEYTFLGLVGAVIDAPIQAFTNLFNFEIFGTNIKNLLLALFTASIIVVVVKFALGGK